MAAKPNRSPTRDLKSKRRSIAEYHGQAGTVDSHAFTDSQFPRQPGLGHNEIPARAIRLDGANGAQGFHQPSRRAAFDKGLRALDHLRLEAFDVDFHKPGVRRRNWHPAKYRGQR